MTVPIAGEQQAGTGFGEFFVRDILPGIYTLAITADGWTSMTLPGMVVRGDIDLGESLD